MNGNTKEKIFRRIAAAAVEPVAHPGSPELTSEKLATAPAHRTLEEIIAATGALVTERAPFMASLTGTFYSLIDEVPGAKELHGGILTRDRMLSIERTLARGTFLVRENGAVWVCTRGLSSRSALFTCTELVIFLNRAHVVETMHDAMRALAARDLLPGCFIAGPSKTADIEQHLVIGAQGARQVTVVLEGPQSLRAWIDSAVSPPE